MIPCQKCRIYNTNDAAVCHQCGTPFPKKREPWLLAIKVGAAILLVVVLVIGFTVSRRDSGESFKLTQEPASLELLYSEGFPTISGKTLVEGQIRNISGINLKKVYIMVSWFDKDGKKVENTSVPISTNPLLDHQDSSFRVIMSQDPRMDSYEISFFDASGNILKVIDSR